MAEPRPSAQDICEALRDFVRDQVVAEGVEVDARAPLDALGIDSFSIVEMLLFVERRFGVLVPDAELTHENLASLDALSRCAHDHTAQNAGGAGEPAP